MPEKLNLNVGIPGDSGGRRGGTHQNVTLSTVLKWIDSLGYDEYTTKQLKNRAKKYPMNTYYKFRSDLSRHIAKIQELREKE